MLDEMPEPLTTPDCDCTDLDGFMLNVERLMASELVALSTHEAIAAALFLWCRAWKQRPAASLPDDDRVNAAFARLPLSKFLKLKPEVMRGFVKCTDGRLYHRHLAQEATLAFEKKTAFRKKRDGDAERLRKWRVSKNETHDETRIETIDETRFVAEGQGQGQVRDREKEETSSLRSESSESPTRKRPPKPAEPEGFAAFYEVYPRKEARPAAAKAYGRALAKVPSDVLFDGAKRYAASRIGEDSKFTKQPATWLNNDCWADQLPLSNGHANGNGHAIPTLSEADEWRRKIRGFKEKSIWRSPDGPAPDNPDCLVPRKILAEFGYGATP